MLYLILGLILVGLIIAPQLWVKHVLAKYSKEQPELPGTGGELAAHLIERFKLQAVTAEATLLPDHYDPSARKVRLGDRHFNGKSLSAIAIAAHEVGHAIQHARQEPAFLRRTKLAKMMVYIERFSSMLLFAAPVVLAVVKAPAITLLMVAAAILTMLSTTVLHLLTLPVEWDASFGKALPILAEGQYIDEQQLKVVRHILRAAAFTYVAGSLASLLNLGRWIRVLRR